MIFKKSVKDLLSDESLTKQIIQSLSASEFYEARRGDVLKSFYEDHLKIKFEKKSLEWAYTDKEGNVYCRFPKKLGLPIDRFAMMKKYLMWMVQGISPDELDSLLDIQEQALASGIKDAKNAAKIGVVIEEIRMRRNMTIHTELLYNFLAVQWVRQDEDPLTFNNEIQKQKVESFQKETASGNSYFFFQQTELKMLSSLFSMSEQEWAKYWNESLLKQEYLKAFTKMNLTSGTESDK